MGATVACPTCSQPIGSDDSICAHCGENVAGVILLEALREETLGQYEVLAELGSGGMASVFVAHDLALDRRVALKVMSPVLLTGQDTIERFKREAQTAAALSHPHIIPIYAVNQGRKLLYIAMKCVEGRTLGSIIGEVGRLPIEMVQAIVAQVGGALGYAHRRGVVHRDVKPDNIMIDNEGWAVVTDFGIAKVSEATNLTATGAAIGTPAYMSPEQCSGEPVTGASDQYSLGIVAYEMLTGKPPFSSPTLMGMMWAHVNTVPPPIMDVRADCSPTVAEAVGRMLAKQPADRFPSVEDAVAAMGVPSLAPDDPTRTSLIELAQTGEAAELIAKIRTPSSPVPLGRRTEVPGRPSPSVPGRSRALKWLGAAAALGVAGVAWWFLLLRAPGSAPTERSGPVAGGVTVSPGPVVAAIRVEPPGRPIPPGTGVQLSATTEDAAGNPVEAAVAWASSDVAVATVSQAGFVTALEPGTVQITARSGSHSAAAVVVVREPPPGPAIGDRPVAGPVASVTLSPPELTLSVGDRASLRAVPRDARGAELPGRTATWSSNDPAVATVSARGIASGVAEGSAVITGTVDGRSGRATVVVSPVPAARVQVTGPDDPIAVGSSRQFRATVYDAEGRDLADRVITWSSSDPSIATVSTEGFVTGVGAGRVEIVATTGNRSGTRVAVVAPPPAAPQTVRPARPAEVEAVIREYAAALEARDIDLVKRLYPGLPGDRERAWQDLFALGEITVTTEDFEVIALGEDAAEIRFRQTLEGRRIERNSTVFVANLARSADGWRILSIR